MATNRKATTHPFYVHDGFGIASRHKTWSAAYKEGSRGHRINFTIGFDHPTLTQAEWVRDGLRS